MAYTIKLGTFSKLENSTAQPVMTSWAEYTVTFKEGADYSNPVLAISADFSVLYAYNYAYMLGRYYWITDIQAVRSGYCSISLKVDVLATYKSTIGNADLYVLRSSAASDGTIRDNFYATKASATCYHQDQNSLYVPGGYSSGRVVLSIPGIDTMGGTTLLQFTDTQFKNLVSALYAEINGFQLDDVISQVVQLFGGNPIALINNAMWFPWGFSIISPASQVHIGAWAATYGGSPIVGGVINNPVNTIGPYSYTLYKHPQAASRGAYLNMKPYTQYTLGIPGCGVIELDGGKLLNETQIDITYQIDAFTGQMIAKVDAPNSDQRLAYLVGQIGIPITIKGTNNAPQMVGGAVSTVGGLILGAISGNPAAIAGAAASGISTAVDAVGGSGTSSSVGAGAAGIMNQPGWLDTVCYGVTDADNSQEGRPLCQIRKPSNIGGFIRVADGYVEISGPLPEQQEIKRFLESGFFYN